MRALTLVVVLALAGHAVAQKPDASAEALRTEMVFWDSVRGSSDPADYRAYLDQYPDGRFAALARNRLAALTPKPAAPVAAAASAQQRPRSERLPQAGDTWSYVLTEPKRVDGPKQRSYTVKVVSASSTSIQEHYALAQGAAGEWTHAPGSYLLAQGPSLFSPYLDAFAELALGTRLGRIEIKDSHCDGSYACRVEGRVVGREPVRTAAGTFDSVKVVIQQSWSPVSSAFGQMGAQLSGGRTLTVWYSPQAKRAVKYSSRATFGSMPPIETDFDLELVGYQLK